MLHSASTLAGLEPQRVLIRNELRSNFWLRDVLYEKQKRSGFRGALAIRHWKGEQCAHFQIIYWHGTYLILKPE